jgi:hypothetical protein
MDFGSKLKSQIPIEFGKAGVSGVEGMKAMNDFTREIKEGEYCDACDCVKSECKCKKENKESTGAASAGGYSQPLFTTTKRDIEEITKVEATEATDSSSSGQYSTTSAWAKSTSKKDWKGKSKTQIPGGKFVQVNKKCKKFPYCNQGDIDSLILSNEAVVKNLCNKYNITESTLRTILINELNSRDNSDK